VTHHLSTTSTHHLLYTVHNEGHSIQRLFFYASPLLSSSFFVTCDQKEAQCESPSRPAFYLEPHCTIGLRGSAPTGPLKGPGWTPCHTRNPVIKEVQELLRKLGSF
jgi:hypothetical protein